jgi:hypothetical protein
VLAKVTVVKIANYGTSVCGDVAAKSNLRVISFFCFFLSHYPTGSFVNAVISHN